MAENKIVKATKNDIEELLSLYRANLYGPAKWNENYPSEETIDFDLKRDALYVMKNDKNEIIAAISIDDDEEVERLEIWQNDRKPGKELSRLCVREDYRNQGIAREMMRYAFDVLRTQNMKSVHIIVIKDHIVAIKSYMPLGFEKVGECTLFEKEFVCMEMEL